MPSIYLEVSKVTARPGAPDTLITLFNPDGCTVIDVATFDAVCTFEEIAEHFEEGYPGETFGIKYTPVTGNPILIPASDLCGFLSVSYDLLN